MKPILCSLFVAAALMVPGTAVAADAAVAAVALEADPALELECPAEAAPVVAAGEAPLAMMARPLPPQCCAAKERACEAGCRNGVFEFNCDTDTCRSSCICEIG